MYHLKYSKETFTPTDLRLKKKIRVGSKARQLLLEQQQIIQQMKHQESQPAGNNKTVKSHYSFNRPATVPVSDKLVFGLFGLYVRWASHMEVNHHQIELHAYHMTLSSSLYVMLHGKMIIILQKQLTSVFLISLITDCHPFCFVSSSSIFPLSFSISNILNLPGCYNHIHILSPHNVTKTVTITVLYVDFQLVVFPPTM